MLAESDKYKVVEGNIYFPSDSVKWDYFKPGDRHTACPWKGKSKYYDIVVGDKIEKNAAMNIKGHLAFEQGVFGRGVMVER